MSRKLRLIFLLLSFSISYTINVLAQNSYVDLNSYKNANKNLSLFGNAYNLDFRNGSYNITKNPDTETGYREDTYTVSDPRTGERILYTKRLNKQPANKGDVYNIYNKYGEVIENGQFSDTSFKLFGQVLYPALVPFFNGENKFYLFYTYGGDLGAHFKYAIIDMEYDNGRGRILPQEKELVIQLDKPYEYSSMIGIPGNNCNYYIIVYSYNTYRLEAFEINWNGLNTNPIQSMDVDFAVRNPLRKKNIVISPDRSLVAISYITQLQLPDHNTFIHTHLFKFDPDRGIMTKEYYNEMEIYADSNQMFLRTSEYNSNMNISSFFTKGSDKLIVAVNHFEKNALRNVFQYDLSRLETNGLRYPVDKQASFGERVPVQFKIFDDKILTFKNVDINTAEIYSQPYSNFTDFQINNNTLIVRTDSFSHVKNNIYSPERAHVFGSSIAYPFIGTDTIQTRKLDTTICTTTFDLELEARPGKNYKWNTGSTDSIIPVTNYGKYWVEYADDCATRIDTFMLRDLRDDLRLPEWDTTVCEQRFPWLLVNPYKAEKYIWNGVEGTNEYKVYTPTDSLVVTVDIQGCRLSDTLTILSKTCECDYFMPNAFTPNNDGLNDYMKPIFLDGCVPYDYAFEVYNRWGHLVYKTNSEFNTGWDGTVNGKPADIGNYYYQMYFKSLSYPEPVKKTGEFTLIR